MKKICQSLPFLLAVITTRAQSNYVAILPSDTEQEIVRKAANVVPTPRQLRWQQLELTAFFHFGVNTFTDKEWGDGTEDEKIFNPTKLDANQWIRVCKKAGIKQVILTVRHHDGFCLWPSKYTEHSVKNSPWENGKGDVVKEVAEACKNQNMGFGIYLSPWDRNSKLYGTDAYNDYFVHQLTELLTHYGRIDEVWFDGANGEGPNGKKQVYAFDRWYKVIRTLQPAATIAIMGPDVRWVGTESGYGREQEWSVVPVSALSAETVAKNSQTSVDIKFSGDMTADVLGSREKIRSAKALAWYPAETDVSIRPGWFYHQKEDSEVKSPEKLMDIYYNSVGKNSVLLLNIPPDREGLLSDADVKSLLGWRALRDSIFKDNLVKRSVLQIPASKQDVPLLDDGNVQTGITLKETGGEYIVQLKLDAPRSFNILQLQEEISKGQRVESFVLEGFQGGRWEKITEGSTIGYKRILKFKACTTDQVRLRITSSRLQPTLAEMGLYHSLKN
ncbi:MAG: alpha-L-fucosidase [Bacteroidota bacterium]|nr:alpha-L-fucosidase [Bacteroidota bacterium]MDP4250941.1 alpha-L-fucosidase [Bacteroidota bacterium]